MNILLGLLVASTMIADVPEGFQVPKRDIAPNDTTGACANNDYGPNRFDVNGVCIYEVPGYGWFYVGKDNKAYGSTCTLSDQWCNGFSTKEQAIEASKKQ